MGGGRLPGVNGTRAYRGSPEDNWHAVKQAVIGVRAGVAAGEERRRCCGAGPIGGIFGNDGGRIRKSREIHQAVEAGRDNAHGSKAGPDNEIPNVVEVATKFPIVLSSDPGDIVGELHAAFVHGIERSEVVTKRKSVRQVNTGLPSRRREGVVTPRVLGKNCIHERGLEDGVEGTDQSLIAKECAVTAAGCADTATIEGVTD